MLYTKEQIDRARGIESVYPNETLRRSEGTPKFQYDFAIRAEIKADAVRRDQVAAGELDKHRAECISLWSYLRFLYCFRGTRGTYWYGDTVDCGILRARRLWADYTQPETTRKQALNIIKDWRSAARETLDKLSEVRARHAEGL